jgi:transcriptional regulator with XRE-family HTH domain
MFPLFLYLHPQFAQKIGVTSQHVSMFEGNKAKFSDSTIRLICLTFRVNEQWLRTGEGDMIDDEAMLSEREKYLLEQFGKLSFKAQDILIEYADKILSDEQAIYGGLPAAEPASTSEPEPAPNLTGKKRA